MIVWQQRSLCLCKGLDGMVDKGSLLYGCIMKGKLQLFPFTSIGQTVAVCICMYSRVRVYAVGGNVQWELRNTIAHLFVY